MGCEEVPGFEAVAAGEKVDAAWIFLAVFFVVEEVRRSFGM